MVQVKKVLNSSVILFEQNGQDVIALGKGIGYGKKTGDIILTKHIDKLFYSIDDITGNKLIATAESIPAIYFEIADQSIKYAEEKLNTTLNDSIYFSLADHLEFAVQRIKNGVEITNKVYWEIKYSYPIEFETGMYTIELVKNAKNVELPESEAANIAFHIINGSTRKHNQVEEQRAQRIVKNIANIVRYSQNKMNENTFQRFVTHVKYFAERIVSGNMLNDETDEITDFVKQENLKSYNVLDKIVEYLVNQEATNITREEKAYLLLHLNRLIN